MIRQETTPPLVRLGYGGSGSGTPMLSANASASRRPRGGRGGERQDGSVGADHERRARSRRPQVRRHGGRRVRGDVDRDGGGRRSPFLREELDRSRHGDVTVVDEQRARLGRYPCRSREEHPGIGRRGRAPGRPDVGPRSQHAQRPRYEGAVEREEPDRGGPRLLGDRVGTGRGRTMLLFGEPARRPRLILAQRGGAESDRRRRRRREDQLLLAGPLHRREPRFGGGLGPSDRAAHRRAVAHDEGCGRDPPDRDLERRRDHGLSFICSLRCRATLRPAGTTRSVHSDCRTGG